MPRVGKRCGVYVPRCNFVLRSIGGAEYANAEELGFGECFKAFLPKPTLMDEAVYGTAKCLARQLGENECAKLLSHTLGEESTDFLLTAMAEPMLQQLSLDDVGGAVNLETVGVSEGSESSRKKPAKKKVA
jgi:hypothetical protein